MNRWIILGIILGAICVILGIGIERVHSQREHCVVSESYDYVELLICLK